MRKRFMRYLCYAGRHAPRARTQTTGVHAGRPLPSKGGVVRGVDVCLEVVRRDAQGRHEPGRWEAHVLLHVPVGVPRLEQQLRLHPKIAAGGLRDPKGVDAADRVVGGAGTHVGIDGREAVQLEPARQVVEVTRVGPGGSQALLVALCQGELREDGGMAG